MAEERIVNVVETCITLSELKAALEDAAEKRKISVRSCRNRRELMDVLTIARDQAVSAKKLSEEEAYEKCEMIAATEDDGELADKISEFMDEYPPSGLLVSQRAALDHADKISKLSPEDARALVKEILKIKDMTETIAVKVADILPQYPEDVRAILQKERIEDEAKRAEEILAVVEKYN